MVVRKWVPWVSGRDEEELKESEPVCRHRSFSITVHRGERRLWWSRRRGDE